MRAEIRRMIVRANSEDAVAQAVREHEGWQLDVRETRRRLMGALRSHEGRHFDAAWARIAIRESCRLCGRDVAAEVVALYAEAQAEGHALYLQALAEIARAPKVPIKAGGKAREKVA